MQRIQWRKIFKFLSLTFLTLILVFTGLAIYTVRQSFPQENGSLTITGLKDKVEVVRDRWGIPHIYASNPHDLFMAQGYIHAQDRFWQMDFWRHAGSGRLAEMFGKSQVKTDRFLRTLGWERVAKKELAQLTTAVGKTLQAYADGVNAYLGDHQGGALSLEYAVLKLLNPNYQPEPWQPLHTLTWGKVMAWDLGGNMEDEIERTILLKTLTPAQIDELYPPYPSNHPVIVSLVDGVERKPLSSSSVWEGNNLELVRDHSSDLEQVFSELQSLAAIFGDRSSEIGSNNWVISGKRTTTGKPFLSNDPHLAVQMPSIWYEVGLHCLPKNGSCPYDVTGFSFAGMAGVIIGHNDRVAWGVTNTEPDVMDLYIEKINPHNPNQYEVNGKWVDMQIVKETIQVTGDQSIDETVRYTRHGPIISDTFAALKQFEEQKTLNLPQDYAIALRWTALERSHLVYAIEKLNLAQNWEDFRAAAQDFDVPAQNLIYADLEGNIGYQMPGRVPIRVKGDGRYPVAGWTDEFEWQGYIPFEKLPTSFNPADGFIATANNAVIGKEYPYLITMDWDYGYRAQRIADMIMNAEQPITIADMQNFVGDNQNLSAKTLVPILLQIPLSDQRLESARKLLQNWDFQNNIDSPAAAIFAAFWKHLLANTFHDDLPQDHRPNGGSRWMVVMENLIKQPNSRWWDNQQTPEIENRDRIFLSAFTTAIAELEKTLGADPLSWQWGNLHTTTFRNLTLGKSGVAPIEALFNRGKFPTGGGSAIVNATSWNAAKSFEVYHLPSMRMIIDLSKLENSLGIHSTGQSGHAFHSHYTDMIDPWRKNEFHPMLWDRQAVIQNAKSKMVLWQNSPA